MRYLKFLLCIALFGVFGQVNGQIYIDSYRFGITQPILDEFTGGFVAYSLRKLDKDYTGSAIRVRRSNDNAQQDIGFVDNYLDTAALKTFVGNNNGFIVTWYNQADSSGVFGVRNLTQSTAANQQRIVNAGALDKNSSGDVAALGDATDLYTIPSKSMFNFMHNGTNYSIVANIQFGTTSDPNAIMPIFRNNGGSSAQIGTLISFDDRASLSRNNGTFNFITNGTTNEAPVSVIENNIITPNTSALFFYNFDPDNATAADRSEIYVNNGSATKGNTNTFTPSTSNATNDADFFLITGYVAELIIWNTSKAGDRTTILNNLNTFYSIY